MSEQELNSYRFSSGKEHSDEMLNCIMKEVAEEAMARRRETQRDVNESVAKQRSALREKWNKRLSVIL